MSRLNHAHMRQLVLSDHSTVMGFLLFCMAQHRSQKQGRWKHNACLNLCGFKMFIKRINLYQGYCLGFLFLVLTCSQALNSSTFFKPLCAMFYHHISFSIVVTCIVCLTNLLKRVFSDFAGTQTWESLNWTTLKHKAGSYLFTTATDTLLSTTSITTCDHD